MHALLKFIFRASKLWHYMFALTIAGSKFHCALDYKFLERMAVLSAAHYYH
jgi:hypothetical protein